jgi:hypothetical protein
VSSLRPQVEEGEEKEVTDKPIVLQDPSNDQEKIVLELFDVIDVVDTIPRRIEMQKSTVRALDDVVRDIYHVPKKYRNYWVDLGYDDPIKILWDPGGHPYIDVAAKRKPEHIVRVMLKEQYAEGILDLLLTATDFCDYCKAPLNTSVDPSEYLGYCSGGIPIADVRECPSCEAENIRWDKEFLEWHPKLGLKTR